MEVIEYVIVFLGIIGLLGGIIHPIIMIFFYFIIGLIYLYAWSVLAFWIVIGVIVALMIIGKFMPKDPNAKPPEWWTDFMDQRGDMDRCG